MLDIIKVNTERVEISEARVCPEADLQSPVYVEAGLSSSVSRIALGIVTKCGPKVAFELVVRSMPLLRFAGFLGEMIRPPQNALEKVIRIARFIEVVDAAGLVHMTLPFRTMVDCVLITGAVASAFEDIRRGTESIRDYATNDRDSDFSDVICGAMNLSFGCLNGMNALTTAKGLYAGIQKIAFLDRQQQEAVIKFRSISTLSGEKSCKAVVIDGETAGPLHTSWDVTEKIYQHCDTLVYSVKNSEEFCSALEDATSRFGQSVDVLSMQGHASPHAHDIGYGFRAQTTELSCLNTHMAEDAQVLFLGCNTATTGLTKLTLAEKLSKGLPGRSVVGVAAYLNPFMLFTRFNGKNFTLSHWAPIKLGLEGGQYVVKLVFGNTVTTIVS
ncbi:MAG: hypothetical protein Q8K75_08995 [Chlamydiales bacterium]|nr:hypothetical protein [Chlamydiales bacterium]